MDDEPTVEEWREYECQQEEAQYWHDKWADEVYG